MVNKNGSVQCMITPKCKIASTEFVQSITRVPMNEDSRPADRVSMGFDAVLAQLQELVSTLSDRVERGEAVIERIEQALEGIGIDLDAAEKESEEGGEEAEGASEGGSEESGTGEDNAEGVEEAPEPEPAQPEEGGEEEGEMGAYD